MTLPVAHLRKFALPVLRQSGVIRLIGLEKNVSMPSLSPNFLSSRIGVMSSANYMGSNKSGILCGLGTPLTGGLISREYHCLSSRTEDVSKLCSIFSRVSILSPPPTHTPPSFPLINTTRSVTKCSLRKGRRKSVGAIKNRFLRLDWGAWISPQPGRFRHLWKKREEVKKELRHHVFRSPDETRILNNMCTKYWIKKKYFVDDPYESYRTRDNFPITKGVSGILSLKFKNTYKYDNDRLTPPPGKVKRRCKVYK